MRHRKVAIDKMVDRYWMTGLVSSPREFFVRSGAPPKSLSVTGPRLFVRVRLCSSASPHVDGRSRSSRTPATGHHDGHLWGANSRPHACELQKHAGWPGSATRSCNVRVLAQEAAADGSAPKAVSGDVRRRIIRTGRCQLRGGIGTSLSCGQI